MSSVLALLCNIRSEFVIFHKSFLPSLTKVVCRRKDGELNGACAERDNDANLVVTVRSHESVCKQPIQ